MRVLVALSVTLFAVAGCASEPLSEPAPTSDTSDGSGTSRPSPEASGADFQPLDVYPAGPYGSHVGSVIDNHAFLGWRDPVASLYDATRLDQVKLSDFYDPDGSETELIVVNASAVWCPVCRLEMATIDAQDLDRTYRAKKVRIIGVLFQDVRGDPAKPADLTLWGSQLNFTIGFPLVLDPGLKLGPYFSDEATPLNLVIDARTMRILEEYMGYGTGLWSYVDQELRARGVTAPP